LPGRTDGYRRLGVLHRRQVSVLEDDRWIVEDGLVSMQSNATGQAVALRLHWLLPDWPWKLGEMDEVSSVIRLHSPSGPIILRVLAAYGAKSPQRSTAGAARLQLQIVRAGELLHGQGQISPTWGWVSPTYGQKKPALSLGWLVEARLPFTFTSQWSFPA
jgi:hypothetical protein